MKEFKWHAIWAGLLVIWAILLLFGFNAMAGEPVDWKLRALQADVRVIQYETAWTIEKEKTAAITNRLSELIRVGRQGKLDAATRLLVKYKKELAKIVKPGEEVKGE